MDFLGLKTLTDPRRRARAHQGEPRRRDRPRRDPARRRRRRTSSSSAATRSPSSSSSPTGMREWMRKLKPTGIDDLIAMNALYRPGPMDLIPNYIDRKHGPRGGRAPAPDAGRDPRADVRHPGLPGAGDADGAGDGRLHARRRRPPAPRDGQEGAGGDGQAARDLRRGRDEEGRGREDGERGLRHDGEVRGLRLQQVATRPPTPSSPTRRRT